LFPTTRTLLMPQLITVNYQYLIIFTSGINKPFPTNITENEPRQ
jgi:hypothetical protein